MVQYYHGLCPKRSEILALLKELAKGGPTKKNGPIEWDPACTKDFQQMKALIANDTILNYPDFSKKFTFHTDASDVQLGALIMQEGKTFAFYSKK